MSYFTLNSDFFRLRHFGHPVWKKVQENVAKQWEIYNQLITNRKVTGLDRRRAQSATLYEQ